MGYYLDHAEKGADLKTLAGLWGQQLLQELVKEHPLLVWWHNCC